MSTNGCLSAYKDEESAKAAEKVDDIEDSYSSMHLELSAEDISEQAVEDNDKSVVALQPEALLEAAMD